MPREIRMVSAFPRIIVINLAASTERRKIMEQHLKELGLEGEFFSATDGRQMSEKDIAAIYDDEQASKTEWGKLTRGEIGCAISHRRVWQMLLDSGEAGFLVLEDDIVLAPDVPKWLAELTRLARDGDVIPFVKTSSTPYFFRRVKLDSRWLIYANQSFIGATAYYITPLAARRLLAASHPIHFPTDCWYSNPGFKGATPIRVVWPEAVTPRAGSNEASTIGFRQAHVPKVLIRKNWLRRKFSEFRRYLKNRFLVKPVRFH